MPDANDTMSPTRVAIACQGGGAHTAFTAGVLQEIFRNKLDHNLDQYQIVGLSGTSGGAICAFLAWYGWLTQGPQAAIDLLGAVWGDLTAQLPGELLWNQWCMLVGKAPVQVKVSPYNPLFEWSARLLEQLAPRKEFVDFPALLGRHVSFDQVGHIGQLQKTMQAIQRIVSSTEGLPAQLAQKELPKRKELVRKLARQALDELPGSGLADEFALPIAQEYKNIAAGKRDFKALRRFNIDHALPTLLIGAIDVLAGKFKTFDSRKGEIDLAALLASAALPTIFKAQQSGTQEHWDGLFAHNPAIRSFLEGPDDRDTKPDQIWLLQINPLDCKDPPEEIAAIEDRVNELTGNISLYQELTSIATVNRWLGQLDEASRKKYKHIDLLTIPLDTQSDELRKLSDWSSTSKLQRDPPFIAGLIEHGQKQARRLLPLAGHKTLVRSFVEEVWNNRRDSLIGSFFDENHALHILRDPTCPDTRRGLAALQKALEELRPPVSAQSGVPQFHVVLDDVIAQGDRVAFRWTLQNAEPVSDRPPKVMGTWIWRIEDGMCVESWFWDTLGVTPAGRPTAAREVQGQPSRLGSLEIVRQWIDKGWQHRDPDAIDLCFATDYVHTDYGYFPEVCDRADYKQWFATHRRAIVCPAMGEPIVEGDRVVVPLLWGEPQEIRGVVIYRVAGGAIQESCWTWDTQALLPSERPAAVPAQQAAPEPQPVAEGVI